MDFTAPSFSLGSEFDDDDDEPFPPAKSDEQARAYTAPDAPSFFLGIDFEGHGDGGDEPYLINGGRWEEEQRRYEAPDAPSFSLGIDSDGDGGNEPHLTDGGHGEEQRRRYEAPDAPSFSLGIDSDGDGGDEPHITDGAHREERQRRYEAPDAPPFSLAMDFDDHASDEPRFPDRGRREDQARHYEAPDAPSFSLGIDDDDDDDFLSGGGGQEQARAQVPPRARTSLGTVEEDNETLAPDPVQPTPPEVNRFKRLRRGPAPPPLAPTPPPRAPAPAAMEPFPMVSPMAALGTVGSWEDEIEDCTDEEKSVRDMPPSVGSCITSSNSKFSLVSHGVLMSQSSSKAKKFTHSSNYSVSKSLEASCSKKLLPKITLSPMRKIHLLDSDTDSDDNKDRPTLQQNSKSQENTVTQKRKAEMNDSWATPALDEFCDEYFKSVKDLRPSQCKVDNIFCGSKVTGSNYSISETTSYFPHQSIPSEAALDENISDSHPPAMHYFFHHDPLVRELVRQRLRHFVPIGADCRGEQTGAENFNDRNQFDHRAADRWVTPNSRTSVATGVGKKRVNAGGMSGSGHWFTGDDGKKVYVSKNGQELTGSIAYRQYKKESGNGFRGRQSKRKSSAGTNRGSTRAKKATTTAKQGKTRAKRKR